MRQVVIVDEVRGLRALLRRLLEEEGYAVVEAPDGRAARALLRASSVPLVTLLNTGVAGDGLGLLRAAAAERGRWRHAFVLLTANAEGLSPQWRELIDALEVPVVPKPFDLDVLLAALRRAEARLVATPSSGSDSRGPQPIAAGALS